MMGRGGRGARWKRRCGRGPIRQQLLMMTEDLDSSIGPEHVARAIRRALERMEDAYSLAVKTAGHQKW